ncbi:MAG: type II secretion system F family protein [Phycisphaeraceae bacterium]|nr:MAG: type II secretion system F family protein [Phycisphaeraceae bacterium]
MGRLEASDEKALRERLRMQGLIPIEVRTLSPFDALRSAGAFRAGAGRARRSDSVWFFQTLHQLLVGKAPVESALATMEELAPNPRLKKICADVRNGLRGGDSLADAVDRAPGLADAHHMALLRVGHESGRLEHVVSLIVHSLETSRRVRKTVAGRLIYPAILLIVAVAAVWIVSSVVIPRFMPALEALGAELPPSTQITLAASRWMVWILPPLILLGAFAISSRAFRLPDGVRQRIDRWSLRAPIFGQLRWHSQAGVIADTLATIVEGGGDVLIGLEQAERALTSDMIRDRLSQARREVREGVELGEAMDKHRVLPPMVGAIVRIGMRSGDLVGSLRRAANLCVEKQEETTERLLTLMGPCIILLLAGVIGWVIISLIAGITAVHDIGIM